MGGMFFVAVYILLVPLVIVDTVKSECGKNNSYSATKGIAYLGICAIILFFSCCRNPLVGTDSANNREAYYNIFLDKGFSGYEAGYIFFVRLTQRICVDFQFFLVICSFMILLPIFYVVWHYPYRAYVLSLFVLGGYNATFDVLKGYLAFSFVLLGGFLWKYKKKRKLGAVLMLLAHSFHIFVALFVVAYVAADILKKKEHYLIIAVSFGLLFIPAVHHWLLKTIIDLAVLVSKRFSTLYSNLDRRYISTTYILFYFITNIFSYLYFNRLRKSENSKVIMNLNFLMLMGTIGLTWFPSLSRYCKMSMIFSDILVGQCLRQEKDRRSRMIIMVAFSAINIVFAFLNNGNFVYKFFFEE